VSPQQAVQGASGLPERPGLLTHTCKILYNYTVPHTLAYSGHQETPCQSVLSKSFLFQIIMQWWHKS